MEFRILGHACLLVKTKTHSVIIDPWLLGSCYWRSWWNFPGAVFDEQELRNVDAVIISHIHWDHWHGPTLKRFFKGKHVIVPDEPSMRSRTDLRAIGFKRVTALPHAKTTSIGDIDITLHQFGLFLNDAAVVIEAEGTRLLNANDAKIAGWPLLALMRQHGNMDFAFRSHSSANSRLNFHLENAENGYQPDDRQHYFRSFCLFMDAVQPTYAVPFASNHCHLHPDTQKFNAYISNPLELRNHCDANGKGNRGWELKVMLPGSKWSNQQGFSFASEAPFVDLKGAIEEYQGRVSSTMARYEAEEARISVSDKTLDKFLSMFSTTTYRRDRNLTFILNIKWPNNRYISYEIDLQKRSWRKIPKTQNPQNTLGVMTFPAIVFKDAVWKNMFHHAGISKRCEFFAQNKNSLNTLSGLFQQLERREFEVQPLTMKMLMRMTRSYIARWRELFVYAEAAALLFLRKTPLYLTEEAILSRRGGFRIFSKRKGGSNG